MIRKALVTGAAHGIGKAIALDLASQGFDVVFHYLSSTKEAELAVAEAEEYGVKAVALQADITQASQAQNLVKMAVEALGGLSVVVNNVGNYIYKPLDQMTIDEWHHMMDSNLNCTFYLTQSVIPHLKASGWGRIINFSFATAQHVVADNLQTAYRIAKTGVIIYTKSLAEELIKHNITANVVSPGVAENSVDLEETLPLLPAGRPATLQEVSHAVNFFIRPESGYITGQVLEVAGGLRL